MLNHNVGLFNIHVARERSNGNVVAGIFDAHGMTGWLRVPMPPSSLFEQGARALRQLLQKRYAL